MTRWRARKELQFQAFADTGQQMHQAIPSLLSAFSQRDVEGLQGGGCHLSPAALTGDWDDVKDERTRENLAHHQ